MSIINNTDPGDNKRTIIAVALSVIVITAGFWIQGTFFPQTQHSEQAASTQTSTTPAAGIAAPVGGAATILAEAPSTTAVKPTAKQATPKPLPPVEAPATEQNFVVSTDLLEATFTNKGGELISLQLKKHKDEQSFVNIFPPGTPDVRGFSVAFGDTSAVPMRDLMNARMIDPKTIEFSRTLFAEVPGNPNPIPFTYKKVYSFHDGEYLFGLAVELENSANVPLPLNQNGTAYTLSFGPRIGPTITQTGSGGDIRKILVYAGGKRIEEKQKNQPWSPNVQPLWSAITGKYFTFIAIPQLVSYGTTFTESAPSTTQTTAMAFTRPAIPSSSQTDTWYFYFGPNLNSDLSKYDYSDRNGFQLKDLQLETVLNNANILKPLEDLLKFIMNLFYKLIPNYGVSIILLTILVKVLFFPLSRKSSMASARMAELQPKMAEIQAKYKNNPQKLNQELAEFYKKEGYNPMSGCLPLLIQFPLFIAMYNLFNTHFDLRGASFIPGWIPDLSMPESIWHFGGFALPILGWTDLRLLPIIYVGSQLLYGKFTQMPQTGQSASQMKIMMYGMPIMFFFILYNVPSGLLVYWIAQNILTIAQQVIINDYIKVHKAKAAAARLGK
ncbi:MAG: membrane protein insertase YidC [Treponema sp.]|nr:membrane protein insertase YidC [Treponema sp.]